MFNSVTADQKPRHVGVDALLLNNKSSFVINRVRFIHLLSSFWHYCNSHKTFM